MANDLEGWFTQLPYKLRRELAGKIRSRAQNAADRIAEAAPVAKPENVREHVEPGALRDSVRVRRRRNELDLEILAGGPTTTRQVRKGSGTDYDYALATEFGNEHAPAQPWFFATWEGGLRDETAQGIADDVADIVRRA